VPEPTTIPDWLNSALHQLVPASRHFLITPEADLRHDLTLDHIAPLDLAEAILDATGREIPAEEIDGWFTVSDILASMEHSDA
jgi:acyl carrier protein